MKHTIKQTIKKEANVSIIILSAGCGDRIKGYGTRSLLQICGTTLINYQTDRLNSVFVNNETTIVVGFEADKIINEHHGLARFVENQLYEDTGSALSLKLGLNSCISDSVLIMHGDLWFNDQIFNNINLNQSFAMTSTEFDSKEVGCVVTDNQISNFAYGLETKWAQIVFLTGLELKLARRWINSTNCNNKFTFECLNYVLNNRGSITAVPVSGTVIEIDNPKVDLYEIANATKR